MHEQIGPTQVFQLVREVMHAIYVLDALVALQIAIKVAIFTWVIIILLDVRKKLQQDQELLNQTHEVLGKVTVLIEIAEGHAKISDRDRLGIKDAISSAKEETKTAAAMAATAAIKATTEIKKEVQAIPDLAAEKTIERLRGTGDSVHG